MKKIAVMLADGFEEIEALTVVDILKRAKMKCDMVSIKDNLYVKSTHDIEIKADKTIDEADMMEYDMIVLPGGLPGASNLSKCEKLLECLRIFDKDEEKYIGAICAAPAYVLPKAGIEKDRYITSYPAEDLENRLENASYVDELVAVDANLITSRGPATAIPFAYKLVEVLEGNVDILKETMLWNMLLDNRDEIK